MGTWPALKIAHVTSDLCRRSAGLGAAVAGMSAATLAEGNDVRVFGLSSPGWRAGESADWTGAPATVFETAAWSGPLRYAPGLLPALMDFAPEIVHLHGLWTYPSIAVHRWQRRTGRPFVVSAHGMLMPPALSYKPGRKWFARRLFQDRVIQTAAVRHSTSNDEQAAYRALGLTGPDVVIPLGIDTIERPEVSTEAAKRRVLFLGRLHQQKGLDWLLEAWARIELDFPDWELSIVGPLDENFADKLREIRKRAGGAGASFAAPLYGEDKFRWIAGSDLFVLPSRSENFGIAAAEALMMEVPVIATRGTPWSGLSAQEAGWWIEPGAPALEAALRAAMKLPRSELRQMGRKGRRWLERDFAWPVIGRAWQDTYKALAERPVRK